MIQQNYFQIYISNKILDPSAKSLFSCEQINEWAN